MIRVDITNPDGSPYGWIEMPDQPSINAWVAASAAAGSPWANNSAYALTQTDLGNAPQMASVRQQRDAKLASCDWTQLADCPLASDKKALWVTYRQALRDLPDQQGFDPSNFSWPSQPA
jgi:hypothetical protein